MTRTSWLAFALSSVLALRAYASPAEPDPAPLAPGDFAYGREISLPEAQHPVVRVDVPVDVYRAMRGPDLSEVMVFNGRGAQVPHAIRSVRTGSATLPEMATLPVFPLRAAGTSGPPGGGGGKLELEVERDAQGQVVRIAAASGSAGAATSAQLPIAAYVLDARALTRPVTALRVQLAETADDRVFSVRLEATDDLLSFSPIEVAGALVQLGHGGDRIDRDLVTIPPTRAKFYRLSPSREASFPSAVTAVVAQLEAVDPPRPFERLAVYGTQTRAHVYRFDLGGPVPVDRVEVELPEPNTIVNAELGASVKAEGPFPTVARLRAYRVANEGVEVRAPASDIARRTERYYELRVEPKGGGIGVGAPVLVTFRAPDEVLLMRRGEGPFTLAYGRYAVQPSRFDADDLLSLLPRDPASAPKGVLGERKTLGGPERLQAPEPPPPYKTYAIWVVLVLGVLLLGALAVHLARSEPRRS